MYKYRQMDMRLCRPLFFFQKALYKSEKIYIHTNAKKLDNVSISLTTILK